jgi:hypothetical protein
MPLLRLAVTLLLAGTTPVVALAQSAAPAAAPLSLELNAVQDAGGACRLTFLARNDTGTSIEKAVFETVVFDESGAVVSLSLFDFRDLPADRPRVRQFDVPGIACDAVGQVLINGAGTCRVDGADSGVCDGALSLSSRLSVGLIG